MADQSPHFADREVSPMGWAWFLFGLLLAIYFGGAVRLLGSERLLNQWLKEALAQAKGNFAIQTQSAELLLARRGLPVFGVEVRGMRAKSLDRCQVGVQLESDRVFFPLSLWSALSGRFRFGDVSVDWLRVNVSPPLCSRGLKSDEVFSQRGAVATPPQVQESTQITTRDWRAAWDRVGEWVTGLKIANLELNGATPGLGEISAEQVAIALVDSPRSVTAQAQIRVREGRLAAWFPGAAQIAITAQADSRLAQLNFTLPMREGTASGSGDFDFSQQKFLLRVSGRQMPISLLMEGLRELGLVQGNVPPKRSWMSADLTLNGETQSWQVDSMAIAEVSLEGEMGQARIPSVSLKRDGSSWSFSPFAIRVEGLSLAQVFELANREGYRGILRDFGRVFGDVQVRARDELSFKGEIRGLSVRFSRDRVRFDQIIDRIGGDLQWRQGRVSGVVHDIAPAQGRVRGAISFDLDGMLRSGTFQAKLDEIVLHPRVQEIMLAGEVVGLSLTGNGRLDHGQVANFSGEIAAKELRGSTFVSRDILLKTLFDGQAMRLQAQLGEAEVAVAKVWGGRLAPVSGEWGVAPELWRFRGVLGKVEILGEGGRWQKVAGRTSDGRILVSSQGEWFANNEIQGQLSLEGTQRLARRWLMTGTWLQPELARSP